MKEFGEKIPVNRPEDEPRNTEKSILDALESIGARIESAVTRSAQAANNASVRAAHRAVKAAEPHARDILAGAYENELIEQGQAVDEERQQAIYRQARKDARKMRRAVDGGVNRYSQESDKFIADTGQKELTRRDFLAGLTASAAALASSSGRRTEFKQKPASNGSEPQTAEALPVANEISQENRELSEKYPWMETVPLHDYYDGSGIDWFRKVENGDFSDAERAVREETLPGGERIFRDIGYTFYKIQSGDTVQKIRKRLAEYPEFAYLKDISNKKINSFNISNRLLKVDDWIPLPKKPEERELSDKQLMKYIIIAIEELLKEGPEEYKSKLQEKVEKHGIEEVAKTVFAIGINEAGGRVAGQHALHRYEKNYSAFSYSHFHVLMIDWGLRARRKLNLSEGQLVHPVNGAKACIAFMIEKKRPFNFFPINRDNETNFAYEYNGPAHKKNRYVKKTRVYLERGDKLQKELNSR